MSQEAQDQIKRRINEIADRYAGSMKRSGGENDMRADLREKVEEMGYSAKAFQPAVAIARTMNKSEAEHYLTSMQFFVESLMGRQGELFPDDVAKMEKRAAKKAAKDLQANQGSAGAPDPDTNPRSNPDAGGAKPQVPVDNSAEQAEGDAALDAMTPQTKAAAKKRAQSAIANEIAEAAGTIN